MTTKDIDGLTISPAIADPTGLPTTPRPAKSTVDLPETLPYRIKNKLLGPPLNSARLIHERLGKPTALAVFASDNLSSSAYASEEILRVLLPAVGVAAFSLVVPVTFALLIVLGFLILSYRQTIKAYPTAGGAYIVTRDNFGLLPAQVAGVALLTDYVLTVSVSVAAGTAALTSAFSGLTPYSLPIAIAFVVIIAYVNLTGVRESGKVFAVPTYFFILNMVALLGVGLFKMLFSHLPVDSLHHPGLLPVGRPGNGLFQGAALFVVLHAFASGGAAVTGVEAISNGVPAFKEPAWKNARTTLVIMGTTLGVMFLGLSILAAKVHAAPFENGTPTVISQVGALVYGSGLAGKGMYYALQAGTMLILVLAANTSFADFPRLASFHAEDNFMPRQLTKRGHRLVFSNGIISLAVVAVVVLIVTNAKVDRLIPLYAIGVFTSFTLSQAGMAKHHITHKEPKWRSGLLVNGIGAFLSLVVDIIIAITKFTHGAWAIIVMVPIMVAGLMRLNRQYEAEAAELAENAPKVAEARILRRHLVIVFIDTLDVVSARAIQYARSLTPDELRVVHFELDPTRTDELSAAWRNLGLSRLSLDVIECPDRRLARAAAELVADLTSDGETEVSVLLPRRQYVHFWHRFLHDRSADQITDTLSTLRHCNVTIVPYQLRKHSAATHPLLENGDRRSTTRSQAPKKDIFDGEHVELPDGGVSIDRAGFREHVLIAGRVRALRVQPLRGVPTLECTLVDGTGEMVIVFLGRRQLAGVRIGTRMAVEGRVGVHQGTEAIINPTYELQASLEPVPPPEH